MLVVLGHLQFRVWVSPPPLEVRCDKMQSGIRWPPLVQNWPGVGACERHGGMSFALRASLGDSCDVYRPASMTVGGNSSDLFRQELGLSSDSKIPLIYGISIGVFLSALFEPHGQTPSRGR